MAFAPSTTTSGNARNCKRSDVAELMSFKMKANQQIWKGDIVVVDVTDGYVWALQSDAAGLLDTGDTFAGIAAESVLSCATAGVTRINVYVTGIFQMKDVTDALAVTDMGVEAYGDATVLGNGTSSCVTKTATPANLLKVGRFMPPLAANTTTPYIRINGYAGCRAASS